MQTLPGGAVGFSGVPVQPGFVSVVVGAVYPPAFCGASGTPFSARYR
jgi:hypothetical protein